MASWLTSLHLEEKSLAIFPLLQTWVLAKTCSDPAAESIWRACLLWRPQLHHSLLYSQKKRWWAVMARWEQIPLMASRRTSVFPCGSITVTSLCHRDLFVLLFLELAGELLDAYMKAPELRASVRITVENQTEATPWSFWYIYIDSVHFLTWLSNSQFFWLPPCMVKEAQCHAMKTTVSEE